MGTDGQRKSTVYSVYHAKSLETEGELGSMVEKPSLKEKHGGTESLPSNDVEKGRAASSHPRGRMASSDAAALGVYYTHVDRLFGLEYVVSRNTGIA